jgi:membrane-associated PAP2 superfamily phosphatase
MKSLLSIIKNKYFVIGWLIVAVSLWMQQNFTFDRNFQDFFFSKNSVWMSDRLSPIFKIALYSGAKYAIVIATLVLAYFSIRSDRPSKIRKTCAFIFCMIFIPAFVSFLKSITEIHCPNELIFFDGKVPFRSVFDFDSYKLFLKMYGNGNCFPGGHATGGFAFMSSFFVLETRHKRKGIIIGFLLGTFMSLYQMMKGAHFLSHNLFTMGFSFIVIVTVNEFCTKS